MKIKASILTAVLIISILFSFAQSVSTITGKLLDSVSSTPVEGASIAILGTRKGTVTKSDGSFVLTNAGSEPVTLHITSVSYLPKDLQVTGEATRNLSILLSPQPNQVEQVVVTASRVPESILKSPVTIERLGQSAIRESAAPSFYDAIGNMRSIQVTTLSLGYQVLNTRGFAGTTNSRFLQMVDGVDNFSPGIGAPLANAIGPSELDIESVELVPGVASALYGLNAVNGIANLKTKSASKYTGLSLYQKVGVNHVDGKDLSPSLLTESAIRWAQNVGKKFSYKLNFSYFSGTDWVANNYHDQYFDAGNKTNLSLANANPAADLINRYGDEYNSDLKTLTLGGKKYDVSRTGYNEKDLTDYSVKNTKFDAGLEYRFNAASSLSYTFRIGTATNMYQRGNRVRLDGEQIQQHVVTFNSGNLSLKGYYTAENTGNSYNLRPLAENIDLAFKKPAQWYGDYTKAYNAATSGGASIADAHAAARQAADQGRYLPGTAAFDSVRNKIIHTNNWDTVGAAFILKSSFVHLEGTYDFSKLLPWVNILVGGNYRNYIVHPDGNNFVNPASFVDPKAANQNFQYYSWGSFIEVSKAILDEKLKLSGSLRVDQAQYFSPKLNPRITAVYSPSYQHNFRVSFQNGYRFPTLFEGFAYVNNGGVRRLGGLPVISQHLQAFENSYTNTSVIAFKNAVNQGVNGGLTQSQAIAKSEGLLQQSTYTYIQPEHVNSFEVGYKSILSHNRLFLDISYYFSAYDHFIGQLDVTQPYKGVIGVDDSTSYYVYQGGKQVNKYKMWTNSKSRVTNQGLEVAVSYLLGGNYKVAANASYATLIGVANGDAFTPSFNTPDWILNFSIGNPEVFKHTGFNLTYHWQNRFYWNSPLAQGYVPSYGTLDAQVSYHIKAWFSTIKLGASNILNQHYYQYLGGPNVGGLYYISILADFKDLAK